MLRYVTTGESHGPQLTAVLDGMPAGLTLNIDEINHQLARRQFGFGRGGRMKIEKDQVQVVSGLRGGVTLGSPITLVIPNLDWPNWVNIMHPTEPMAEPLSARDEQRGRDTAVPRPGHADLAGGIKWGHHDLRNVLERASARETAARTAIGAVTRQLLESFAVQFASHVLQIGEVRLQATPEFTSLSDLTRAADASEVRCVDPTTSKRMASAISAARADRDSVGGVVEILVRGLPAGLGSSAQWDRRLDSQLAGALMAIQSVKGVELGAAFENAGKRGSEVHDEVCYENGHQSRRKGFCRKTNRAGGIEGGMTNGEDLVLRVAAKPISTLNRPLASVNVATKAAAPAMVERTDHCVVPAVGVIGEAVVSLVLADAFLEKFGCDNIVEIQRHFEAWLNSPY